MSTLQKMNYEEFKMLKSLANALKVVDEEDHSDNGIANFVRYNDLFINDMHYSITNNDLYEAIQRWEDKKTGVVGIDNDGVGFRVVEILHNDYDNVFGYREADDGYDFYYCETKTTWNDELERDETHFFVDDEPVILEDCTRV